MAVLYIGRLPGKLSVCAPWGFFGPRPDGCRDGAIIGGVSQWLLREERGVLGLILSFCFFAFLLLLWFGFRRIPFSRRSIGTAPVRGGSYFLCCCKESNQRKQLSPSKVLHTGPGTGDWPNGPPIASALNTQPGLARTRSDKLVIRGHWFSTKQHRHSATRCRRVHKGNHRFAIAVRWKR